MTADPDDLFVHSDVDPMDPSNQPSDDTQTAAPSDDTTIAQMMAEGRSVNDPVLLRSMAKYVAFATFFLIAVVATVGVLLAWRNSENTAAWAFIASLCTLIATCVGILGGTLSTRTTAGALKNTGAK
jgi:hypothetical protein